MISPVDKLARRERRARRNQRVNHVLKGTPERPRIVVNRSNRNISAQIVDDVNHVTLCASSSISLGLKGLTVENAAKVGEDLAKKAVAKGITVAVFDRHGYLYHGRVQALCEAMRKNGMTI